MCSSLKTEIDIHQKQHAFLIMLQFAHKGQRKEKPQTNLDEMADEDMWEKNDYFSFSYT